MAKRKTELSDTEKLFFRLCKQEIGCEPVKEWQFAKEYGRRWRSDYFFFHNNKKVAIEIEGGGFTQGRHTRGTGHANDMQKYNTYALMEISLLRFPPKQFQDNMLFMVLCVKAIILGEEPKKIIEFMSK